MENKKPPTITKGAFVVPTARFERATYGLEVRCSIQLSYVGIILFNLVLFVSKTQKLYLILKRKVFLSILEKSEDTFEVFPVL